MTVDEILKDAGKLENNYQQLLNGMPSLNQPHAGMCTCLDFMPTTHSFGYEIRLPVDKAKSVFSSVFPYERILFADKALLSDSCRRKSQNALPVRKMNKAREYGLDEYVFCHLGSPEYYYSQYAGSNTPAFGIFLSPEIESNDLNANATLYDLESSLVGGRSPEEITLATQKARQLTAYEVANKYDNDLLVYWICRDYEKKNYHDKNTWEHKREFHYYERVGIENILAIIWPVEMKFDSSLNRMVQRQGIKEKIDRFRKNHKNIKVYAYPWNQPKGQERFSYASYLISNEYYKTRSLISEEGFEDAFTLKFSRK